MLKILKDHKFEWPQEALKCGPLTSMQLPSPLRDKFQKLEGLQDYTTGLANLLWDTFTSTAQKTNFFR